MHDILKNSYVILLLCFILLCMIFYLFEIGYTVRITSENKVIREFSWKYPLAISLIVWIFWHFYIYPSAEELEYERAEAIESHHIEASMPQTQQIPQIPSMMFRDSPQRINMINWN